MIPHKIDRWAVDGTGHDRIQGDFPEGADLSTPGKMQRWAAFVRSMGISFASWFIPIILDECKKMVDRMEVGTTVDMSEEASKITFNIICLILFGDDLHGKLESCVYESRDGQKHEIEIHDATEKTQLDCVADSMEIYNVIFPEMVYWNIGTSNRRNTWNAKCIRRVLRNFVENSSDKSSVYQKIIQEKCFEDWNQAFEAILGFMNGGHETSSKALCTAMLELKRHPEVH